MKIVPCAAVAGFILACSTASSSGPMIVPPVPLVPLSPRPSLPAPDSPAVVLGRALARLFTGDDYPVAAMERLEQRRVTVELGVTPEGRVGLCQIVNSSGSVALDRATCAVLTRRARFQPARDRSGRPVADRIRQSIRWEMESLPFEPNGSISIVQTNGVGAIVACRDETAFATCSDPDYAVQRMTNLVAGALPPSTELVRTIVFTPGDQRPPTVRKPPRANDRLLFAGSARVAISRNGRVTKCVETARVGGKVGALCAQTREWLFKVDPDNIETRSGVWSISLASRPPKTGK